MTSLEVDSRQSMSSPAPPCKQAGELKIPREDELELELALEELAAAELRARSSAALLARAETEARRRYSSLHTVTLSRLRGVDAAVDRAAALTDLVLAHEDDRWAAAAVLLDEADDPAHAEFCRSLGDVERICDAYMEDMNAGPELVGQIEDVLERLLKFQCDDQGWAVDG
jgi:hypothetical protein